MTEPASGLNRRAALRGAAVLAVAAASLGGVEPVARVHRRVPEPTTGAGLPDIQFDVAAYCAPEQVSPTGGPYVMPPCTPAISPPGCCAPPPSPTVDHPVGPRRR